MPIFSNQLFDYNFGYLPPQPSTTTFNITYDDLRPEGSAGAKRPLESKTKTVTTSDAARKRGKVADAGDMLCINTIRLLSADMVQGANSGHPGAPMGCAPMAHALWRHVMTYNPANPAWINRDRFVLSNGHACALLYSLLHISGFELSMDDLKSFRKLGSKCPGHPENVVTAGVEVTTGPLGQGLSMAVGMALAQAQAAATYNREGFPLIDNHTFVICGDGCLQEGITSEASSLAGHLGLGRLVLLWDDNRITIDGSTDLSFTEDVLARYASYGWHTLHVPNGDDDVEAIIAAVEEAKAETDRPTIIRVTTTIGKGSLKEGTGGVHGAPLGEADIAQAKRAWGFDDKESFAVSDEVYASYKAKRDAGAQAEAAWQAMFQRYAVMHPTLAAEFERRFTKGELPAGWETTLPTFTPEDKALATRQSSQLVLNKLCDALPELVGGSADLTPSNLTKAKGALDFQKETPEGRYIRFGVREHAMAAICNGISAFGGYVPFCATFLNFAGYALGAIRISAISEYGVIYVMTHDSIGLGEDGPTHQPVEMLLSLRSMPNVLTLRPCDSNEVSGAYRVAMANRKRPSVIALSRQGVPNHPGSGIDKVDKGAYTLHEAPETGKALQLILVASGSEVGLCVQVAKLLEESGVRVRVVSMPCWELFDEQSVDYRKTVFPKGIPVLAVEAATMEGWSKYCHAIVGMEGFGASGPAKDLHKKFGFTVDNVVARAKSVMDFYSKGEEVPWLMNRP